ncbi:MAG: TonB-dependent receptor [Pseudomonadota bacterium]|nr:TonB-dependent receptor [Pseudomonadota bacterium]
MAKLNEIRAAAFASSILAATFGASAALGADEVLVTAQKRAQSLQDVPISVEVISGDRIDDLAADNIADIDAFVPGLDVGAGSPTQPRYAVRGVKTDDFGVGTDPAVGVYIDGVYSARSGAAVLSFNDIERIEVLKGPQGTLFGRNAAAGAVSITTKKPSDEFEAQLGGRFGNYGKKRGDILLNVPLQDRLSLRVNAVYNERDGLYEDAATGEDLSREKNWAARAALRWRPTDQTDVIVAWTHDELDQDARPAIGIVDIPAAPAKPPVPPVEADYLDPFTAPIFNDVIDNHETRNLDEVTLTVSQDLAWATLKSITSWREFETENREDEDGTNRIDLYFDTNNREQNRSWYQELSLSGETSRFDWLVGASYYTEKANQISDTFAFTDSIDTTLGNLGFGTPFSDLENFVLIPFDVPATMFGHGWREAMYNEGRFKAYALYADVIAHVTDRLNLTVGLRYTHDKKSFEWFNGLREAPELDATLQALDDMGVLALAGASPEDFQFDVVFDLSGVAGLPCDNGVDAGEGVACILEDSWSDVSPRVVVDYQLTDNVLVYASYAQGYKAGGFNSVEVGSRFDNEDVVNYEAGVKSSFPDLNLTINASGFHYVYNDKQSISLVQAVSGSSVPQYIVETSDDQAWGADLQIVWTPVEPVDLFFSSQYIDTTYKRRITRDDVDLSGEPTGEPKWSLAAGGKYTHELGASGRLELQALYAYRGQTRCNSEAEAQGNCLGFPAFALGEAQHRTDLRARWVSANEKYELGLFVNNLFDDQYVTSVNNITAATIGTPFVGLTEPRFWGGDFKVRF